jgi:hypothetical protein
VPGSRLRSKEGTLSQRPRFLGPLGPVYSPCKRCQAAARFERFEWVWLVAFAYSRPLPVRGGGVVTQAARAEKLVHRPGKPLVPTRPAGPRGRDLRKDE